MPLRSAASMTSSPLAASMVLPSTVTLTVGGAEVSVMTGLPTVAGVER